MASHPDAYSRGSREPDYFESASAHSHYYAPEPRESSPSSRSGAGPYARGRYSHPDNEKMASAPDPYDVSPEIVAAIAEKVKRELMEHMKQTGTFDDQADPAGLHHTYSNRSSSTSSPPPAGRRAYTPPSPTQTTKPAGPPPTESFPAPPTSPMKNSSGVRFSDRTPTTRPAGNRSFSTAELSTIDQKWGRLFDREGVPTQRLGQFLRGMANYIIEDYTPAKSIVVTPAKMATFYADYAIETEPHPLLTIFRAQSNEHISRLYQDLGCQHHLVQAESRSAPSIPALTALGFAQWMTIHILAYPELEWQRLEKVVLGMPINADGDLVDGKPERLPKQISRHLLPDKKDPRSKELLDNAILDFLDDLGSTDRRKGSIASPPLSRKSSISQPSKARPVEIHQQRTSSPPSQQPIERERKPYASVPSVTENNDVPPVKIERERQPYTAQPGSGKVYSDNGNSQPRITRTNSTASRPKDHEPYHQRTSSTASQPYMAPPRPNGRRPSSPPLSSFSQSTPSDINASSKYGPPPSSSSSSFATSSFTGSYASEPTFPPPPGPPPRQREDSRYRRGTDDDLRYPSELNGPRDAERWDRLQESRGEGYVPYERGSVPIDPREGRGAPAEEWYRERDRGRGADYRRYG